jgi:plasmid maintenance system antidote protein VapI
MTTILDPRPAAEHIRTHGWTQGQMYADDGAACLTGGLLKACQPGDGHLLVQVYRRWDMAENWNDKAGRTADEVIAALDRDVTAEDLAETFGPQWEQIVALVRRAAVLTADEAGRLLAAWDAAGAAAWDAAWAAASDAAWAAAGAAARAAAWAAARDAARDAAWDAAWALVVRDLIGQHGLTQEHYDTLTRPWRTVIGPIDPDDAAVTS